MGNYLKLKDLIGSKALTMFQAMVQASCKQYLKEIDNVCIDDVAFYFGLSVQTIRKNSQLPYTTISGKRFYRISDIEALMTSNAYQSNSSLYSKAI